MIMNMIFNTSQIKRENYPRPFYELSSWFLWITLDIFANNPRRHPDNNVLDHPRLYIELPSPFDLFS